MRSPGLLWGGSTALPATLGWQPGEASGQTALKLLCQSRSCRLLLKHRVVILIGWSRGEDVWQLLHSCA